MSRRVWFSIGSNLGDRAAHLQSAVDGIAALGRIRVSRVYETKPVGVTGQPDYLNAVVEVDTDASPRDLLGLCAEMESRAGRVRVERWGARTLDIDIIAIEGERVSEPDLQVPHPRAHERGFVLVPLAELVDVASIGFTEPTDAMCEGLRLADDSGVGSGQ